MSRSTASLRATQLLSSTANVSLPPSASQVVEKLKHMGFEFDFVPNYDLRLLSKERRVQVRATGHYAPKGQVAAYKEAMSTPSSFPPVVVTQDHFLVDGNTRSEAADKRGLTEFHALVVPVDYEAADNETKARVHCLAAALNQLGGQRLDKSESREAVRYFLECKIPQADITAQLGVPASSVRALARLFEGEKRAKEVGIETNRLSDKQLVVLGGEKMLELSDEMYRLLGQLAVDANLNDHQVKAIIKDLHKADGVAKKKRVIDNARDNLDITIIDTRSTKSGTRPTKAAQLRRVMGQIGVHEGQEDQVIECDEDIREGFIDMLMKTQVILMKIAEANKNKVGRLV